jgi:hypothetical protein
MRVTAAALLIATVVLAQDSAHPAVGAPPRESAQLRELIAGYRVAMMVGVVAELGVPDILHRGPKTAEDLALETKTHGPSLYRVLRILASYGVFEEDGSQRFRQTAMSELLRTDAPGSQRDLARNVVREMTWRSNGQMLQVVRTGKTGMQLAFGMELWDYLSKHPSDEKAFNERMSSNTRRESTGIARTYDFSKAASIVDLGGGEGVLLEEILAHHRNARGVLFEQNSVIEAAKRTLSGDAARRIEFVTGDFFKAIPQGRDVYILKNIIHDWDDARSVALLEVCQKAMKANSRLLIIEGVVPAGNVPSPAKIMDINMLVVTGGRERTEAEHRALLTKAGLRLTRVIPVSPYASIVEAVRESQPDSQTK